VWIMVYNRDLHGTVGSTWRKYVVVSRSGGGLRIGEGWDKII
jgi:hypothetical protein